MHKSVSEWKQKEVNNPSVLYWLDHIWWIVEFYSKNFKDSEKLETV